MILLILFRQLIKREPRYDVSNSYFTRRNWWAKYMISVNNKTGIFHFVYVPDIRMCVCVCAYWLRKSRVSAAYEFEWNGSATLSLTLECVSNCIAYHASQVWILLYVAVDIWARFLGRCIRYRDMWYIPGVSRWNIENRGTFHARFLRSMYKSDRPCKSVIANARCHLISSLIISIWVYNITPTFCIYKIVTHGTFSYFLKYVISVRDISMLIIIINVNWIISVGYFYYYKNIKEI